MLSDLTLSLHAGRIVGYAHVWLDHVCTFSPSFARSWGTLLREPGSSVGQALGLVRWGVQWLPLSPIDAIRGFPHIPDGCSAEPFSLCASQFVGTHMRTPLFLPDTTYLSSPRLSYSRSFSDRQSEKINIEL